MSKIRGWTKVNSTSWRNIYNPAARVSIDPYNDSYIVTTEKGFNAEGLITIERSMEKALKSAAYYMRGHPYGGHPHA